MKIKQFISITCLSCVFTTFSYQSVTNAQQYQPEIIISQGTNTDNSATLEKKGEEILNLFFAQKFTDVINMTSPQLRSELSVELIEELWDSVKEVEGQFKKITDRKVIFTPGSDLAIFTIEFEKVTEDWIIIFNDQEEIIGVDFPSQQDIDKIAQNFVNNLAKGDFSRARIRLHPFLKERIFAEQLQTRWDTFRQGKGDFQGIDNVSVRRGSKGDDTDVVFMDIKFTNDTERVLIIFNDAKSIIGVDFIQ